MFYVWVIAYSAWYLRRADTVLHVAWVAVSYLIVVLAHPEAGKPDLWQLTSTDASRWLLLAGSMAATAFMVGTFRNTFLDNEQRFRLGFERSGTPMALESLDHRLSRVNDAFCALLGRSEHELIGMRLSDITHPSENETGQSLVDSPDAVGVSPGAIERRLVAGDRAAVWVHVASSLVTDRRGRPLHYFAQLLDVTARRDAEEQLRSRAARQSAIADLGQSALKGVALNELGDQVVTATATHLGADLAALLEKDPSTDLFRLIASRTSDAATGPDAAITVGPRSLEAFTLAGDTPVIVGDWDTESRFQPHAFEGTRPMRSAIAVAVHGREHPYGVLLAQSSQPDVFTADDQTFLRALANMLAEAISERSAHQEIVHRALHDLLTGLPNRVMFADLLRHTLAAPRRPGWRLAVILLDIDHFRLVNDSLGHAVGDHLLDEVALRLTATLRTQDTLARFSADEFVILCDAVDDQQAAIRIADRVLSAVQPPFLLGGEQISITATAGIAIATANHTAELLIRNVESAMHRAKERARGRYELFDTAMHDRNLGRLRTENALRLAHNTTQLYLVYQPLVTLASGETESLEVLLRWQHPDRGPIAPMEFIPIAEDTGLIIPIGRRVLNDACDQLATWRSQQPDALRPIAVNISSRQLYDDTLPQFINDTLVNTNTPANLLTLELTETTVVSDTHHAQRVLHELKAIGVRLALDDYGTGYASLSYLSSFPFDSVKLDRTLIQGIGQNRKDDIIISSTIEMSHALGLTVVAEGIETIQQADQVTAFGCDLGQGYYYATPKPAAQLQLPTQRSPHRAPAPAVH